MIRLIAFYFFLMVSDTTQVDSARIELKQSRQLVDSAYILNEKWKRIEEKLLKKPK